MARRRQRRKGKGSRTAQPNVMHPDAAGLDIGSTEVYAAVRRERDPDPIRNFPTFTVDLHALANWLKECQVTTVAMESTGVYWIPVYQILEAHGFEVVLVNARHVHSVPGRKSDVADCEWLRYLHSVGLLRGSFRPADEVCVLRSVLRHRDTLIKTASRSVLHMQKAYSQMNVHLHHAISDLTGVTGMAITDAILAGERDPARLAALADRRIKASRETLIKALQGDWRAEHLLALRHARATYAHYQQLIAECDAELEAGIRAFEATGGVTGEVADNPQDEETGTEPEPPTTSPATAKRFDLRSHLTQLFGTDLTLIPGIGESTALVLFTELGPELSRFPTAGQFASWLHLCPPQPDHWRQNHQLTHRSRQQSRRPGAALGHPVVVPQPVVPGPALPPHAGAPGYSRGDHCDRAQAGADHLPPDHASRGLRRQHPRRRGAPRPATLRTPAPKAGTRPRL